MCVSNFDPYKTSMGKYRVRRRDVRNRDEVRVHCTSRTRLSFYAPFINQQPSFTYKNKEILRLYMEYIGNEIVVTYSSPTCTIEATPLVLTSEDDANHVKTDVVDRCYCAGTLIWN